MISRGQIPETINSQKLLKDFSKEIRHAERYLMSLNPPKPERESKRKKKKPLNKDFVDYDVADRMADNPFKATLKETNKTSSTISEPPSSGRPPLKLTLPKPIMYPYVKTQNTNTLEEKNTSSISNKRSSKPGKQSPTVIRFKLGNNEVVRSTHDDINTYNEFSSDHHLGTAKELTWKQTSIYDFHDGSNESDYGRFTIDESPKRKRAPRINTQKRLKRDYDGDVDVLNDVPKNGIEELLKASAYTLGNGAQRLDVT